MEKLTDDEILGIYRSAKIETTTKDTLTAFAVAIYIMEQRAASHIKALEAEHQAKIDRLKRSWRAEKIEQTLNK